MRKTLLAVAALACLALGAPAWADISVDLIADGGEIGFDAGQVDIDYDGDNIIVTITTAGPWLFAETHVDMQADAAAVPQKNGNPRPGKFAFDQDDATSVSPTEHVYTIPCALTVDEQTVVIAVHAAIEWLEIVGVPDDALDRPLDDPDDILHEETGWGAGSDFTGKNWGMFIVGTYDLDTDDLY
ncbi:MAG: hypothetical protein A2Y76_00595 [Planctomycetes bacterium RBG_13_60_9]|nr:MAG: hypothetical protein A2Y76_00595 [Planctomycetes bacterium RBG_13_60_9]